MASKKKAPASGATSSPSPSSAQLADDAAVVAAALADGDPLDSPDVAPCLHRLRLHREGRPDEKAVTS